MPRDHFDLIAHYYDRLAPAAPDEELAALLAAGPGDWVLDIGGGTGRATQALAGKGARVVVCDLSRNMLDEARTKGLAAVQASADRLPRPAGAYRG